ncbi:hypothetical protein [Bosea sp. BIWAKO-01]|uniref:hypothetical protein n=1 Tax=Bosea sp. BIWAKO-01 TaxID=506668 RepID=UPI00114D00E2|nr:hypothetical protein [Bosea sp. BIWAKO-01]
MSIGSPLPGLAAVFLAVPPPPHRLQPSNGHSARRPARSASSRTGAYVQLREGWVLGAQGKGSVWLRSGNGVAMKLNARRQGPQLALWADGILIGFK